MIPDIFSRLILPFLLGVAIGFERSATEMGKTTTRKGTKHDVGIRTFSLIATLGAISGIIYGLYPTAAIVLMGAVYILILLYYLLQGTKTRDAGITTELALLFTFVSGMILSLQILPPALVIAVTVVVALLLSKKQEIQQFVLGLAPAEVSAFISYALIALVVLPFLPNRYFTPTDIPGLVNLLATYRIDVSSFQTLEIINPYRLWFIVALVTGVDMVGHFIERLTGAGKGRLLAGFLGGFVSSTATTQSLAQESQTNTKTNTLVAAAILANMASFIQLFILLAGTNGAFTVRATPVVLLLTASSGLMALLFAFGKDRSAITVKSQAVHNPSEVISIGPALKFAVLFVTVRLLSKISLQIFGQGGFLATSALASLTGIDAVIINTAEMAGRTIDYRLGIVTIVLVNAVNLIAKSFYSFLQGSRTFALQLAKSMAFIILASFVALAF